MTAKSAAYFMERFKKEEKLRGPSEQAAIDFVLEMLEKQIGDTTSQKEQSVPMSNSLNELLKDAENAIFALLSANALYQITNCCTQFDQKQRAAREMIAAEREAMAVGNRISNLLSEE